MNLNQKRLRVVACAVVLGVALVQATPGLYESRWGNAKHVEAKSYPSGQQARVVPGPYGANAWSANEWDASTYAVANPNDPDHPYWPPGPDYYGGWAWTGNTTFNYAGYIYIPEGSNTVTFAMCFDDSKRLCIDDVEIIYNTTWDAVALATRTLATGWHKFDLWLDNGGGGYGPVGWGDRSMGFGIDWQGRGENTFENFVFPVDPGDGSVFSATPPQGMVQLVHGGVSGISLTAATVHVDVLLSAGTEGALRVYYGRTDGGASAGGWEAYVEYAEPITELGTYAVTLTDLDAEGIYFFRAGFAKDEAAVTLAAESGTFTTASPDAPAVFEWLDTALPVVWSGASWRNMSGLARLQPGMPGDTLDCSVQPRREGAYQLDQDVTVGHIRSGFGGNNDSGWLGFQPLREGLTLTLDPGAAGGAATIRHGWLASLQIGAYDLALHDALTLHLKAPLVFNKSDSGGTAFYLHAAVTGGEASPVDLTFGCDAGTWSSLRVLLCNTNSTFRGDLYAGSIGGKMIRLCAALNEVNSPFNLEGDNRMLGHPENRIVLRNGSWFIVHNPSERFKHSRHISGTGTIRSADMNQWYVEHDDAPKPNIFTATAVLSPGEGDEFGTLSTWGSATTFEEGSTVRLKVSGEQNDLLAITARMNSTGNNNQNVPEPATVVLNGNVEFTLMERMKPGTEWTFATIAPSGVTVSGKLNVLTPYVQIRQEAGEDDIRLIATFIGYPTALLLQ